MHYSFTKKELELKRADIVPVRDMVCVGKTYAPDHITQYMAMDLSDSEQDTVLLVIEDIDKETGRCTNRTSQKLEDVAIASVDLQTGTEYYLFNVTNFTAEELDESRQLRFSAYDGRGNQHIRMDILPDEPDTPMDGGDGVSITVDPEGNREIRVEEPEVEFQTDDSDNTESYDSEISDTNTVEEDKIITAKVEDQLRTSVYQPRSLMDLEEEENSKEQKQPVVEQPKRNRIDPKNIRFERNEKREDSQKVNKIHYNNKGKQQQPKERNNQQRPRQDKPQHQSIFRSGERRNPMIDSDANNEMGEIFNNILRNR
jgi:hypothetical protein